MAVGGTVDASETGMPLLCTKDDEEEANQARPERSDRKMRFLSPAQLSSLRSSSVAKVSATEFCSCSAPTIVTGVPFATRS
jgi:hypothetical protein